MKHSVSELALGGGKQITFRSQKSGSWYLIACFQTVKDYVRVCKLWRLAIIDPHSQKEHTEIHKIPKFGVNQASFDWDTAI